MSKTQEEIQDREESLMQSGEVPRWRKWSRHQMMHRDQEENEKAFTSFEITCSLKRHVGGGKCLLEQLVKYNDMDYILDNNMSMLNFIFTHRIKYRKFRYFLYF